MSMIEQLVEKAGVLIEALPYIKRFRGKEVLIKFGGSAMLDEEVRENVLHDLVFMNYVGIRPVLIHGGGPRITENLKKANAIGVGPKLAIADLKKSIILMEFIDGQTFSEWLFAGPSKKILQSFIKELQQQAKALDKIGLDHGQLAGMGRNILARHNKPVIIDFEKASSDRKCHNALVIEGYLFRNPKGAIARKVKETLLTAKASSAK